LRERWHPLLFAVYPVLFLYAHNSTNLPVEVLGRPLLAALVLGVSAVALAQVVVRDATRGALLASAMMLFWGGYGHVLALLPAAGRIGETLGHHRVLWPLGFILLSGLACALRREHPNRIRTRYLALAAKGMSLTLVGASLLSISWGLGQDFRRPSTEGDRSNPVLGFEANLDPTEDIYHIVLDGYGRADVLDDLYELDNRPFLAALRTRGFCVADSAHSNYAQTLLSVVSTLSGRYMEVGDIAADGDGTDRRQLSGHLREIMRQHSLVSGGAWTRAFATGYSATEILNADEYLAPTISLNEFGRALVAMTPLDALLNLAESRYGDVLHRRRVEFTFEHLPVARDAPPRAYTFAHIIAPHPPFIFAPLEATAGAVVSLADGSHLVGEGGLTVDQYRQAYRAQVEAVNERLLKAVDAILANGRRSVILVHGDHGPGSLLQWEDAVPDSTAARERFSILLALRMSDGDTTACWPSMSPINAIRVMENRLYGTRRDILPDRSFFSTWDRPFDFVEIRGLR
jgi:hypothetical protein